MLLGEYGWMARRGDPVRVTRYTADMFGYRSLNTIRQLQIFLFFTLANILKCICVMNCVFVYRRIAKTQGGEEGSESRR